MVFIYIGYGTIEFDRPLDSVGEMCGTVINIAFSGKRLLYMEAETFLFHYWISNNNNDNDDGTIHLPSSIFQ